MKTRAVFAILSLFLVTLLAMPPTEAGTTQQVTLIQTEQTMGVMEAGAYEMTTPIIMECPWMGYEFEQAEEGETIFAECLQIKPSSPEASPTDFVRLWYTDTPEDASEDIPQHYWRC